jgi:molecular chaperone GrpE
MQQDQENQQPELAAEDVTAEHNAPVTPEARIAELEAALEEAKASVLYTKAEG